MIKHTVEAIYQRRKKVRKNNGFRDTPSLYNFVQTSETIPQKSLLHENFFKKYTSEYILQQTQKEGYTGNLLFTPNELITRSTQH